METAKFVSVIDKELLDVARREKKSVLRQKDYPALSSLNFHDIIDEMKTRCPTVFQILASMVRYDINRENITSLAILYAIIMFRRCHELGRVQRVNTVLLAEGRATREVIVILLCFYVIVTKPI